MTKGNLKFVKELINAFNVSNYGSKINTNFVVEGDNIVVKFNCDQGSAKKYLSQMAGDLIREFFPDEYVAGHFFDLRSFPFHFDKKWLKYDKKTRITKLTVPIDSRVIFNLKVHFAEICTRRIEARMSMELEEFGLSEKDAGEMIRQGIKARVIDRPSPYLSCVSSGNANMQRHFKHTLQAQMNEYGYNYLDFYYIIGNEIYLKDVEDIGFVRSVIKVSKEKAGYNFNFPSSYDLKVRKYKDTMGDLIFDLTKIPIYGYYRDNFIDKDRISNGDHFAFIPTTKDGSNFRYLSREEVDKINARFDCDLLNNVRGQTETTQSGRFGGVYAFSNRQIALLIPIIIENSVINKDGQIEIDPGLRFQALSPAQSPFNSPMHAGPSGIRTPPNQRKKDTDSGYDSNSPPKPKDSGAQSSSGGPRSLFEQPQTQRCPTRSPDGALDGPPRQ